MVKPVDGTTEIGSIPTVPRFGVNNVKGDEMADNQRNKVFAAFLKKQLNKQPRKILDVACGDGRLTVELSKLFPFSDITGLDPKPRGNKHKIKFIRGKFPERIKQLETYDLIAAMHPDEATWPIVQKCCEYHIIFAIVPCCIMHVPPTFPGGNLSKFIQYIINYAKEHSMRIVSTTLKIRGANRAILGTPIL